jgi:hypothetical protein
MPLFFKHQRAHPRMPWGAAIGAAGGIISASMQDGGGGGGSSQQSSSEPWAMAQPWMTGNIMNGIVLQNQMTAQPFSPQQNAAYDNSYALNDYMRNLVPGLLGQIGGQQVGFDPKNPDARPQAWSWGGLLSDSAPDLGQRSVRNAQPPAGAGAAAQSQDAGDFMQQGGMLSGATMSGMGADGAPLGTGGYGSFKYGMPTPQPGTQAYRDMSAYFSNGGADPNGFYGANGSKPYVDPRANPYAYLMTSQGSGGAGGGIGDTGANAAASASGNTAW